MHLHIDLETYSEANLPEVGAHRYARDPSTRILLMAYSYGRDAAQIIDLEHGEAIPARVLEDLQDPAVTKWAHNAAFERVVLRAVLGIECPPEQWRCTMVWAMSLSLPGSLDRLSRVLRLDEDKAKLSVGARLIQRFCKPGATQPDLLDDEWQQFRAYCMRDVEAERAVASRLSSYPMPEHEWALWAVDQRCNDRGLPIDLDLVAAVQRVASDHRVHVETLAAQVSGLANPNSRDQLMTWLAQYGIDVPDLQSATVDALLDQDTPEPVREVLWCRQQMSKASLSKYDALTRATSGGRLRGAFQFAGAGRTGRWAGRIVQPHNLPRPSISNAEIDAARGLIREHDAETLAMLYPDLSGVMSSLLRSTIAAPPGKVLVAADYASIESVMIAWCAQSDYLLDLYRQGLDPYKDFATKVYGISYDRVTKQQRSVCKPAVLGAGYGLGATGLQRYAESFGLEMDAAECRRQIKLFREAYSAIPEFWALLEAGVMQAMRERDQEVYAGRFPLVFDGKFLRIGLPSGRALYYYRPKMIEGRQGAEQLSYEGREPGTRETTHGGKLVENLVQAVARDVLAAGLQVVDRLDGLDIIGHVHDEIICEADADDEDALGWLIYGMTTMLPDWCADAPIRAEGYVAPYYRKD
jgi:DNA polymerase